MIDIAILEEQVLSLNFHERGRLAGVLLKSLDHDEGDEQVNQDEIDKLWLDEVVRRKKEMDEDPSIGIPGDVVLREMRDLLK